MQSTMLTCVRTRCKTSLLPTAVLYSYVLFVCCLHCRPEIVRVAEARWYARLSYSRTGCSSAVDIVDLCSYIAEAGWYALLSYIHTRCSYAVNTADLHSYVLQNLVGTHHCPTFVHAACLPPLPLATFVRAACLPSTSSTCIRMHCKTSLLPTAVLYSYVLLICRLHCRPVIVRVAEARWYARLYYIPTGCSSAIYIVDLRSYVAEARWYALLSYIRTRRSYAGNTADLHSYALQNLVGTHHCPTFVHAGRLPPLPPATFVRAARLASTSSTCIRTCCRTSLVHTAVLHSNMLRVCSHYRWLHSYVLLVCRQHRRPAFVCVAKPCCYPLLSYIRTCCSSAVYIVHLRSYALQKLVGTHGCPTFVRAARLPSTSSTCVHTRCRS